MLLTLIPSNYRHCISRKEKCVYSCTVIYLLLSTTPFLLATDPFLNNLNIRSCKTLRRTLIHIMTSYFTITLIVKNTKLCLQSHQICVVFTIHHYCLRQTLQDVGAISSSCVPMYSLLNVTRNQHTHTSHHIKVVCSINSYALRSLPLNCTHKPQRDASH